MTGPALNLLATLQPIDALCGDGSIAPPDTWHSESSMEKTQVAKEVCAICPGRSQCLKEALDRGEEWGVWGGLDPAERRKILRKTRPRWGAVIICTDCDREALLTGDGKCRECYDQARRAVEDVA